MPVTAATSEVAGRLLLRSEGLSSSMIEGLRVTPTQLALAAADPAVARGDAGWVADNLAVVVTALGERAPLTEELLLVWHRRLMRHATTIEPRHVGAWRDTLGWVGGPTPASAAHVATPPLLVAEAMADVFAFATRSDLDSVTQAAVVHAQFETIHPFADGNGRLGRVLISRTLAHGIGVAVPPPVSIAFARDIGGYLAGLTLYRQGEVDAWVRWFAGSVITAADVALAAMAGLTAVEDDWRVRTDHLRRDAAARRLLEHLPAHPVVTSAMVAELLGVSPAAARSALADLGLLGILDEVPVPPTAPGRPPRWWAATELLALIAT